MVEYLIIHVIETENNKLFFKETKKKLSMYETAKRAITEYFKDNYKDAQESILISLINEENLKKFIHIKTYDDGKAAQWLKSKDKADTSVLGFTEPLPDDFKTDQLLNEVVDPSEDVKIFGKYICPTLGINTRFVSEEPFDNVTKQYNDTLKRELTKFGVELIEIKRKEIGGDAISASLVRQLAYQKKFNDIKKYIPLSTLEYLKSKFTV
jgi:Citrate lyase synthetase